MAWHKRRKYDNSDIPEEDINNSPDDVSAKNTQHQTKEKTKKKDKIKTIPAYSKDLLQLCRATGKDGHGVISRDVVQALNKVFETPVETLIMTESNRHSKLHPLAAQFFWKLFTGRYADTQCFEQWQKPYIGLIQAAARHQFDWLKLNCRTQHFNDKSNPSLQMA